jgi:hypothetical protein
VRRWTLITLIALLLLLVAVAVYQIQLAGRRARLVPSPIPTASP